MITITPRSASAGFSLLPYGAIDQVQASWRAIGGPWQLSLRVVAESGAAAARLLGAVSQWPAQHIRHEVWGWDGVITGLQLYSGWLSYRWSTLGAYANRVAVIYDTGITAWTESLDVVNFGDWEYVESQTGLTSAQAGDLAGRILAKRAVIGPVALGQNRDYITRPMLRIEALGRLPAAARFASGQLQGASTIGYQVNAAGESISTAIAGVVGDTDLTAGLIETNATQVFPAQDSMWSRNAWSRLEGLSTWDDGTSYVLDCDPVGQVHYHAADAADDRLYVIYPDGVRLNGTGPRLDTWRCRPGWYRDTVIGATFHVPEIVAHDNGSAVPELRPAEIGTDVYLDISGEI